ncbi:hypothetical protein HY441_01555, partial [Candidatus Microgenomates bacterium]|nr:hypothetical protein [Candidatus Microgenomates bacterium]
MANAFNQIHGSAIGSSESWELPAAGATKKMDGQHDQQDRQPDHDSLAAANTEFDDLETSKDRTDSLLSAPGVGAVVRPQTESTQGPRESGIQERPHLESDLREIESADSPREGRASSAADESVVPSLYAATTSRASGATDEGKNSISGVGGSNTTPLSGHQDDEEKKHHLWLILLIVVVGAVLGALIWAAASDMAKLSKKQKEQESQLAGRIDQQSSQLNLKVQQLNQSLSSLQANGSTIQQLNVSNVAVGTLSDVFLPSNVALLDRNSQVFTGNFQVFRNSTNSNVAFRVQNAVGAAVFDVDTTNSRVGLLNTAPSFTLDVGGDVNTTTQYRIGGVTICTSAGCTPAAGSSDYIQNQSAVDQAANFRIAGTGRADTFNATTALQTASTTRVDSLGNLVNIGNLTATGAITIASTGAGNDIVLNSADTIELQDSTNVTGSLDVSGTLTSGTANAFNVDASGNITSVGNITGSGAITIASTGAGNDVIIDGADTFIVQDAATFNALATFNSDVDFVFGGSENFVITNTTPSGTTDVVGIAVTPSSAAGTLQGLVISQADSANANPLDAALVVDNADTNLAIPVAFKISNSGGGNFTNIFDILGTTLSAAELILLDGHDVALVDTNDAVATAITGTGALAAGSITAGFGSIDVGADNITTTGTVFGNDFDRSTAGALSFGNTNATSVSICNSAACDTIDIGTNADADTITIGNITGTTALTLQGGTGGVVLQSQGGTLGVGNNAVAQTLAIGNSTGTTTVSVDCGTG